jgi:uncharacterized membrane protein YidH (DUF202 family)
MRNVSEILEIVGLLIVAIAGILSWNRARNDDNIDKDDILWHKYIFAYPGYTVLMIVGAIVFGIGKMFCR